MCRALFQPLMCTSSLTRTHVNIPILPVRHQLCQGCTVPGTAPGGQAQAPDIEVLTFKEHTPWELSSQMWRECLIKSVLRCKCVITRRAGKGRGARTGPTSVESGIYQNYRPHTFGPRISLTEIYPIYVYGNKEMIYIQGCQSSIVCNSQGLEPT